MIELMVAVALVGVLASIAVPIYQGYVAKVQVARAYSELSSYKALVEEWLTKGVGGVANSDLGYTRSNLTAVVSGNVATFSADGSGYLEVTLGGDASTAIAGARLSVIRSSAGTWSCIVDGSGARAWKDSYLPSGCR